MKHYKVTVADKETGREETAVIDAENQSDAERKATESGLMWSAVVAEESLHPAEPTAQPSIPAPAEPSHVPLDGVLEMLGILRASSVCNLPKKIAAPDYELMLLLGGGLISIGVIAVLVAFGFVLAALNVAGSQDTQRLLLDPMQRSVIPPTAQYWTIAAVVGGSAPIWLALGQGILALRDIRQTSSAVWQVMVPPEKRMDGQ